MYYATIKNYLPVRIHPWWSPEPDQIATAPQVVLQAVEQEEVLLRSPALAMCEIRSVLKNPAGG